MSHCHEVPPPPQAAAIWQRQNHHHIAASYAGGAAHDNVTPPGFTHGGCNGGSVPFPAPMRMARSCARPHCSTAAIGGGYVGGGVIQGNGSLGIFRRTL